MYATPYFPISLSILSIVNFVIFDTIVKNGTAGPSYSWFHFPQFQLPVVNCSLEILSGKFQK